MSIRAVCVVIVFLLGVRATLAMEPHSDCTAPFVFSDADVNVVVLPYRSAAESLAPLGQIGQQIALLVKLEVFSHILDYGSVGAVQMEVPFGLKDVESCEPERVMRQVLGQTPGAREQVTNGHGIVFVWGILYEEKDDVVLQTYLRYLRRGATESVVLKTYGLSFFVKPNTSTVVFSPRLVKKETISALQAAYAKADFVRTAPHDEAPGEPLPREVQKCFGCGELTPTAFQVLRKKGEWLEVRWADQLRRSARHGWIHSSEAVSGQPLDQILPELSFAEGVVGYLRLRVADSHHEHLSSAQLSLSRQQFQTFLERSDQEQAPKAAAVAHQLVGTLDLISGDPDSVTRSQRTFASALQADPSDINGVALAAASQLAAEWNSHQAVTSQRELEARFTAAAALADDPVAAIANLQNFYSLLQKSQSSGTPQAIPALEIEEHLREIGLVQASPPAGQPYP